MARKSKQPEDDAPLLGEEETYYDVEPAPVPDDGSLRKIADLAALQAALEKRIETGEKFLANLKSFHKEVSERQLPLAMLEVGAVDFGLVGGARVKLKQFVAASVPKAAMPVAIEILERLGRSALVKHEIKLSFGRDEDAWAKKFLRDLARRKKPIPFARKDYVEPQTLGKFVRDWFAAARAKREDPYRDLPAEVFGIYEGTVAEVVVPAQSPR